MNFLSATVDSQDGHYFLNGDGFSIQATQSVTDKLRHYQNKALTLGIRPSDLIFESGEAEASTSLELGVVVSEYIGAQSVLICECGSQKVMVELKSDTPVPLGQRFSFRINMDNLHLFDNDGGDALSL